MGTDAGALVYLPGLSGVTLNEDGQGTRTGESEGSFFTTESTKFTKAYRVGVYLDEENWRVLLRRPTGGIYGWVR